MATYLLPFIFLLFVCFSYLIYFFLVIMPIIMPISLENMQIIPIFGKLSL